MLAQQNALSGNRKEYPFTVLASDDYGRNVQLVINNETELWELIEDALKDQSNEKKQIKQILFELGIRDTVQLLDYRTNQILEWYETFKHNPTVINNELWIWSVGQLNKMQPRLF